MSGRHSFLLMPLCLEGPPPFRNNNLWRVPSGAIFLIELTALYLTSVLVLLFNFLNIASEKI